MDLNLVRVFVTIYEAGSLTTAAERLYVTQSAVSQSLSRIRDYFDDPVFERSGRGVRPTPLAESVYPALRSALEGIDRSLEVVHAFDAASTDRVFRIALSELGEIGWLPAISQAMRKLAPHARVGVVALDSDELPEQLRRGSVDLAITAVDMKGEFERIPVKTQGYVAVMSSLNRFAHTGLSAQDYRDARRVEVASDSGAALLDDAHRRLAGVADPAARIQHFATLPTMIAQSDELIGAIPQTIAEGWEPRWDIVSRPLPFEMPPISLHLYRRSSSQHAGALMWFHEVVADVLAHSAGEFTALEGGGSSIR